MASAPLNDAEVAQRIFTHIKDGTTDMGEVVWLEPVANYQSVQRLAAEQQLLRGFPSAFCPSAALPSVGSWVTRDVCGVPVVVVRDEAGQVNGFINACRHRGMRVATDTGCAKVLVCGYHGWTYGLDGKLRAVPHAHGFPDLDKANTGLACLHTVELNGIIFVTLEGSKNCETLDAIPALLSADQQLMHTTTTETAANWKIVLEGFIEGYHIRATHPESFLPYGFDNLNVVESFGHHSRVTYPFKRISKLAGLPPEQQDLTGYVTYVYQLFPNVLVTQLSSHTNIVILEPIGIDRTRTTNYTLTNGGDPEKALSAAKKDSEFVGNTGAAEDKAIVEAIQLGLASGANEVFTFGRFESAIVHFHRTLTGLLEESAVDVTNFQ